MADTSSAEGVYGFVGCGTIAVAIVRGLLSSGDEPASIVVSPRNAERAAQLASQFPGRVTVAGSNQAVVDAAEIVFLTVRPQVAEAVLKPLAFRAEQTVVNIVAAVSTPTMLEWLQPVPAGSVVRAVPLPPVAKRRGATLISPPHARVAAIFDGLGTTVQVADDEQLRANQALTSLMGPFYELLHQSTEWLVAQGVEANAASQYTGAFFKSIALDAADQAATPAGFTELVHEQTPGGLNETAIKDLTAAGVYASVRQALDTSVARLAGKAALPKDS